MIEQTNAMTPYEEMDKQDELQVLDEIRGLSVEGLVYELPGRKDRDGKPVRGLSIGGVREAVRHMNKNQVARIRISDREPTINETDEYFEVRIYAEDTQNGGGNWGIKRVAKKYEKGNDNVFALEQALAKAQRNALRGLIPENFVKEMIQQFIERGAVKTIAPRPAKSNGKETPATKTVAAAPEVTKDEREPFSSPADAVQWAVDRTAFKSIDHAQYAYDKIKAESQPKTRKEMWALWTAHVNARLAEVPPMLPLETPTENG